ncbi:MAG: hypothetical protein ACI9ON_003007 [Limisphaerales bacterium]
MTLVKLKDVASPKGMTLMMYAAPIFLYRIGLGGIFGKRFLWLSHTSRGSGAVLQAVLEAVTQHPPKMVAGLIGYAHEGRDEDLKALSRLVPLMLLVGKTSAS